MVKRSVFINLNVEIFDKKILTQFKKITLKKNCSAALLLKNQEPN